MFATSIAVLAAQAGLPLWLVQVRHAAAHQSLPALNVLREAVVEVRCVSPATRPFSSIFLAYNPHSLCYWFRWHVATDVLVYYSPYDGYTTPTGYQRTSMRNRYLVQWHTCLPPGVHSLTWPRWMRVRHGSKLVIGNRLRERELHPSLPVRIYLLGGVHP